MKKIKRIYMERPSSGSHTIKSRLAAEGHTVARCRIAHLMRIQNLRAIYPEAADITYIPIERGAMYLTAVIDWYSRKALARRVSNTMDAGFCVEALKKAIDRCGLQGFSTQTKGAVPSEAFTRTISLSIRCFKIPFKSSQRSPD